MASAMGVRFVRCPKCVKVLAEFAQVPIYRCGGCGTVLRVKVHVAIGEQTSRESLHLAESSSSVVASGEEKVAQSDHHRASNSNAAHDPNGKEEITEHGIVIPERDQARKEVSVGNDEEVTEKTEEPSYYVAAFPEDDDIELTSPAYDGGVSSGDERQEARAPPRKSKRSFRHKKALSADTTSSTTTSTERGEAALGRSDDFHSVQNWMGSEADADDLMTLSKDLRSEPDQMNILRKVDELRDELSEFLARAKEGPGRASASPSKPRTAQVPMRNDHESGGRHGRRAKSWQPAIKQYHLPVRGGAPFVICCKCWKLLQLPADFLVSGKALHKLRCGACSEILVFSFRPRVLPTPPAEEARHSRSESYSSEPEPEPEPVHNVSRSSSYSTFGSRLHRLMGCSSASDILFRSGHADGGGYESSETSTAAPRVDRRRYGAGTSTYTGGKNAMNER